MKRCPPPRMYNLHLQVYLFFGHWTLIPFDEGMQLLFLKLLLGELDRFWQVQTSPSAALFSCVSSSLQIEKCLKLKLSTEEQREALWSAVLGCYPPFLLYKWQDNLQLSQGENESHDWSCWRRHGNVCEVMGSNVRVRGGMRRRGCVCLKLFSMIEKTFCNTFSCQ